MMSMTHRKILTLGLIPGWLAVAAVGFTAYTDATSMKFFLAMNFLMLFYTMIVLGSWLKWKLQKDN